MVRISRRHRRAAFFLGGLAVGLALFAIPVVHAATSFTIENIGASIGLGTADLKETIINVLRWILGILALVAVSFIMYGGFLWLTAAGNVQRIEKAKRVILNAVIGLVIVLISWAIVFFVAKTTADLTGNTGGGGPVVILPGGDDNEFVVDRITTLCGDASSRYTNDVYLCSGVNIIFNHQVNDADVSAAVAAGTLKIEECPDADPLGCGDTDYTVPAASSLVGQVYKADTPTITGATNPEWVAVSGRGGKTVTFYHQQKLFEPTRKFRVSIPKTIRDSRLEPLKRCSPSFLGSGCVADAPGTGFWWYMKTGTTVHGTPLKIASTYPTSDYLSGSGVPDRDVNRVATFSVTFNQPIAPIIDQSDRINPLNNTVALVPFDPAPAPQPDATTGNGGTPGTPLQPWDCGVDDPTVSPPTYTAHPGDFCVLPGPDGMSLQVMLKPGKQLGAYTWYKLQVRNALDMCLQTQTPNPFAAPPQQWVFETNNVVPGVADHYPQSSNACADTSIFIRYTVSMYDIRNNSCHVPLVPPAAPGSGGFVERATMAPGPTPPGVKNFDVSPLDDYSCTGPTCPNSNDYCKFYEFTPDSALLPVGVNQNVAVNTRFALDDLGTMLNFAWSFGVGPPGSCVNAPVIKYISPPTGREGECLSVIGKYFDPDNNLTRTGGDDLLVDATSIPSTYWSNEAITTKAPAGLSDGWHDFKVKAEFPPPDGVLESNTYPWKKLAGSPADGPCLEYLDPTSGIAGTPVAAHGDRFEPPGNAVREVHFGPVDTPWTRWDNNRVDTAAPNLPPPLPRTLNVSLENSKGRSNELPFTLNPIPPDQPFVESYWPGCGTACINALVAATFNIPITPTTLTTSSVILRQCNDDSCTSGTTLTTPVVYTPATRRVEFTPAGGLIPNTSYRAILTNAITATTGGALGGLNYAEGSPTNNAFSWTFKTRPGAGGCQLDRVAIDPNPAMITTPAGTKDFGATGMSEPDDCSATGQPIAPGSLDWSVDNWDASVPAGKATITRTVNDWSALATAVDQTPPGPPVDVKKSAKQGTISATGHAQLTIDFTFCDETTDCTVGGECPGSTCDIASHMCKPILKSLTPSDGAIGTWVGVSGCYFGDYVAGQSKVVYTNNREGKFPNPAICGAPSTQWNDRSITSEVPDRSTAPNDDIGSDPNDATDGRVYVERWDGAQTQEAVNFDVNMKDTPGICVVDPDRGPEGINVTLKGQNFGSPRGASTATFYKELDASAYASWSDTEIQSTTPPGIENNDDLAYALPSGWLWNKGEVAVHNATSDRWSNVKNFDVISSDCTAICTADPPCAPRACGYPRSGGYRCCEDKPTVTSRAPTGAGVCRNAVMTATTNLDLDGDTVNGGSVHVYNGMSLLNVRVAYNGDYKQIVITPTGLLPKNRVLTVKLSDGGIIRSARGASLDPYQWSFTTANLDGPCEISRIEVSPATWVFDKSGSASNKVFTARAKSRDDVDITRVSGVYDWEWKWYFDPTPAPPPAVYPTRFVAVPGDNPTATIQANAKQGNVAAVVEAAPRPTSGPPPLRPAAGIGASVYGAAALKVTTCEQGWYFRDTTSGATVIPPTCTDSRAGCDYYNFDLSYCRDGGLPDLSYRSAPPPARYTPTILGAIGGGDPLLKEFLFKEINNEARDAIGIRVYDNTEGVSAMEWYQRHVPHPGNPSSLAVDGYDAVRDGTTVYVAATNYTFGNFVPLIFLISYNQGASENIVNIYNQMLASWTFNTNPAVGGVCHLGPPLELNKACMQRDMKRIAAMTDLAGFLRTYKNQNSTYPKIESGSFLPQLTFSAWPSWQQRLGGDVGKTLSADPINAINSCAPKMCMGGGDAGKPCTNGGACSSGQCMQYAQDGTCWNETEKSFICQNTPKASYILGYQAVGACVGGGADDGKACRRNSDCAAPDTCANFGAGARIYANLEYNGAGNWPSRLSADDVAKLSGICPTSPSASTCQCFNYVIEP